MSDLKKLGRNISPVVRIGKSGLSENILAEIRRQLKAKKLIKVRVLRSAFEGYHEGASTGSIAAQCARLTGSELINVVGLTFLLFKSKRL